MECGLLLFIVAHVLLASWAFLTPCHPEVKHLDMPKSSTNATESPMTDMPILCTCAHGQATTADASHCRDCPLSGEQELHPTREELPKPTSETSLNICSYTADSCVCSRLAVHPSASHIIQVSECCESNHCTGYCR